MGAEASRSGQAGPGGSKTIAVVTKNLQGDIASFKYVLDDDAALRHLLEGLGCAGLIDASEMVDPSNTPLGRTYLRQLCDGRTYVPAHADLTVSPAALRRHVTHLVQRREIELGLALLEHLGVEHPGRSFNNHPDLRVLKDAEGMALQEVDAVVLAEGEACVASDDTHVDPEVKAVINIADAAQTIRERSGDPAYESTTYSEFRGRVVRPVFMAEVGEPTAEPVVAARCKALGVMRLARNVSSASPTAKLQLRTPLPPPAAAARMRAGRQCFAYGCL